MTFQAPPLRPKQGRQARRKEQYNVTGLPLTERKPLSLSKSRRLVRSSEFRQAYNTGFRISSRLFAAFCFRRRESPEMPSRLGFTLPRALGHAVVRNRIKRRMREATRFEVFRIPTDWNIVFNPKRAVLVAGFDDLRREVSRVFDRCSEQS